MRTGRWLIAERWLIGGMLLIGGWRLAGEWIGIGARPGPDEGRYSGPRAVGSEDAGETGPAGWWRASGEALGTELKLAVDGVLQPALEAETEHESEDGEQEGEDRGDPD